jgi:glycosyltransferase involved in cell wall biosynthesis
MSEPGEPPFLSLVIPAYNEAARLPGAFDALAGYLGRQRYAAELLVVDDGSDDDTAEVVRARAATWPALSLLSTAHRGKGHAVKIGILAARGQYIFLCDADLSMPVEELDHFLPGAQRGAYVVAIASREGTGARRYGEPLYRHLMGRVFNALVRWLVLPGVQDSQCGFKCLRGEVARELAEAQTIDGWGFDVELLYVARQRGYRIVEVPVDWYYVPSSHVRPLRDAWRMAREVLAVRSNARRGVYAARPAAAVEAPEAVVRRSGRVRP